jgi:hypothetical protein
MSSDTARQSRSHGGDRQFESCFLQRRVGSELGAELQVSVIGEWRSAAATLEMEKFRTGRLLARSWQIEDLPLAMQLWGDPAVTALIDSRGKLTEAQVHEKLYAEIERERSSGSRSHPAVSG